MVEISNPYATSYSYSKNMVHFAFVNDEYSLVTDFHTCREMINHFLYQKVNKLTKDAPTLDSINTEKLRLIVGVLSEGSLEKMTKAIQGLNILGEAAKFVGEIEIDSAKCAGFAPLNGNPRAYLLTGPVEWINNPEILSFMLWYIRMHINYDLESGSLDEIVSSLTKLKGFDEKGTLVVNGHYSDDIRDSFSEMLWAIPTLFLWHDYIFYKGKRINGESKVHVNYIENGNGNFFDYSGVVSFTEKDSPSWNPEAKKRFNKMIKLRKGKS